MSIPARDLRAFARDPHDGEALWVIGGLYVFRAVNAETGTYLACEVKGPDGFAIPVDYHDEEVEGFYVATGTVTILLGDAERRLAAGGFALAPPGVPHAFRLDSADATLLLLISPGPSHEALFREMGEPASEPVIPPPASHPPDPELLAAIAARHGTHVVGPPPTR